MAYEPVGTPSPPPIEDGQPIGKKVGGVSSRLVEVEGASEFDLEEDLGCAGSGDEFDIIRLRSAK